MRVIFEFVIPLRLQHSVAMRISHVRCNGSAISKSIIVERKSTISFTDAISSLRMPTAQHKSDGESIRLARGSQRNSLLRRRCDTVSLDSDHAPTMQSPDQCPQIDLTREDRAIYDTAARTLLHETVAQWATVNSTPIDSEHWALVKRRKDVCIFHRVAPSRDPTVMVMVGTGLIDGRLEDVMNGLSSETTSELRTSRVLLGDDLQDGLVLNAHQRRTLEDPFRFAGIKWLACRRAWGWLPDREALTYERMGRTTDGRGNDVAYHTLQSITRPEWPYRRRRPHTAACFLYRRGKHTNKTEVFIWGSLAKSSVALDRITQLHVAHTWLQVVTSANVGHATTFSALMDKADSHQWLASSTTCHVCSRKPRLGSYASCSGCHQTVCRNCAEQRPIFQLSKSGRAKTRRFCAMCVEKVIDTTPFGPKRKPLSCMALRTTNIMPRSSRWQHTQRYFGRTLRFKRPISPFYACKSSFDDETLVDLNLDW